MSEELTTSPDNIEEFSADDAVAERAKELSSTEETNTEVTPSIGESQTEGVQPTITPERSGEVKSPMEKGKDFLEACGEKLGFIGENGEVKMPIFTSIDLTPLFYTYMKHSIENTAGTAVMMENFERNMDKDWPIWAAMMVGSVAVTGLIAYAAIHEEKSGPVLDYLGDKVDKIRQVFGRKEKNE